MGKPKIIVILGPTASGKSDIAVRLARKFKNEIISADSRQVYKGLNIGTGKITKKEMWGVKHHLLDVTNIKKRFTVSDYKKLAEKAMGEIFDKNKTPIVCGGTGFYIDVLLGEKQIPEVPPNLALRKKLERKNATQLFAILQKIDPQRAANIDAKNPRRLVRAIEIAKTIGKTPKHEVRNKKYEALKIGIRPKEKEIKERIYKRLIARIKKGMVEEAKKLHKRGLSWKRMTELGLEYKHLALLLQKKISRKEFIKQLDSAIWHYAKRQITWWKRDQNIHWFKPNEFAKIQKTTKDFLLD